MQIELLAVQCILSRWAKNPAHIMGTTGRSLTPPRRIGRRNAFTTLRLFHEADDATLV